MTTVAITPETRVADLLEAYPQLEETLVQQAACFRALKNPILRRTVARVATLEKAAQMGGIPVRQLVATLRQAAGQAPEHAAGGASDEADLQAAPAPAWFAEDRVRATLDADRLLAAGEVPLPRVNRAVREAGPGELICLVSSFRPVPLLEALEKAGHRTWVRQTGGGRYQTYISRA